MKNNENMRKKKIIKICTYIYDMNMNRFYLNRRYTISQIQSNKIIAK